MKEWQRTVILVIMLAVAIGFIIYLRTGYEHQALRTLQQ
jgi:hypothetical protein